MLFSLQGRMIVKGGFCEKRRLEESLIFKTELEVY